MNKASDRVMAHENLTRNTATYEKTKGHEPYFALTPAGAKRLKEFLSKLNLNEDGCVHSKDLHSFFFAAGMDGHHAEALNGWDMYALLGSVAKNYHHENLFIDSAVLDGISRSKIRQNIEFTDQTPGLN